MKKKYIRVICPAILILLLDQITKQAVIRSIELYNSVTVIPGFFNLVHIRNMGMAFGLFNDPENHLAFYLLTGTSFFAVVLILVWTFKIRDSDKLVMVSLSLILGGILGNLVDRIRYGEVIDFLDVYVDGVHWPAFNLADSSITIGACLMALSLFFVKKE